MSSTQRFSDKVAFVTGAASGIGRAKAFAFATDGARVAVLDRTADALSETAEAVRTVGGEVPVIEVPVIAADVSKPDQVETAIGQVVATVGRLDIAFNNAGVKNTAASGAGVRGVAGGASYAASKHAIIGLTNRPRSIMPNRISA